MDLCSWPVYQSIDHGWPFNILHSVWSVNVAYGLTLVFIGRCCQCPAGWGNLHHLYY
jgi:hypothetical protein